MTGTTRRALALVLGLLFAVLCAWATLEAAFIYKYRGSRSPSVVLEVKDYLGLENFHSQLAQDKWIVGTVYPGVTDGYFVDIGCGHGVEHSNSKALEDLGWKGVAVDPFPTGWESRECLLFKEVVGSKKGEIVRFRKAGVFGGIDEHIDRYKADVETRPVIELTTTTIGDILERANAPSFIHYVSIDTEGSEFEILRTFPFSEYQVGAFTIEHNFEERKRERIRDLLEANGYRYVRQQYVDDWYVLEESAS